jgi:formylglycine-generating enzyme required for sulfatase activity
VHCPQCHKEIADTAKFCPECGTRISGLSGGLFDDNVCPSCHARNRDGVKFCVSCGAGLTCLCPECECEHPVHRPFCGRCGTEVKAFLSVRDSAQKMRAYSNDNKWSRVANEYGHVPKNARLPGGKGQELLAEISALNEAAKTALQQRDEQLSTMATAIKAALQRREELLTAMATAMEKHNYAAAAQAVTECLDIFPANATATEVRKQLDQLAKRVTATAAELEKAIVSRRWRQAQQLAETARHDFPDSEVLADLCQRAVAGAAAEKKNVDDFVAGIPIARALYENRKLVSCGRLLTLLWSLQDSIGDADDPVCAQRMQSALEPLAKLEKDYSALKAEYDALLTSAREKLSQNDYEACSALCTQASALNVESTAAEELAQMAEMSKAAVERLLRKAQQAWTMKCWTEVEAACEALLVYHQGHPEAERLLRHCRQDQLSHRQKIKRLVMIVIVFLAVLAGGRTIVLMHQRAARINVHMAVSRTAINVQDWAEAMAAVDKALALDAANAEAKVLKMNAIIESHLAVARTAMTNKDWPAVLAAADKALALDAEHAEAKQLKANVDAAIIESHLAVACAAKVQKDWPAVLAAADKALALDAEHAEAKALWAESSRHQRVPEGFRLAPGAGPESYTNTGWVQAIIHEQSGIELVYIPAGTFTMGSPTTETGRSSGETQHQVTIPQGFYLGKTEVTQAQWEKVMKVNPSGFPNAGATAPVERVSWDDCQAFCTEAGSGLRLPLEAEWEYACRAGTTTAFHYGDSLDASMANFRGNYPYGAGKKGEYRGTTIAVGQFKPNAWCLYDMIGNVWEWCQDKFETYPAGPVTLAQPAGPAGRETDDGADRVLRGGSWRDLARYCRSAGRSRYWPDYSIYSSGLRVALSAPPVQ